MRSDQQLNSEEKDRIRKHYEMEKALAAKIKASDPADRARVTREAYQTLYESIPWHISRQKTAAQIKFEMNYNATYLLPLVKPTDKVLELGCGTGRTINMLGRYITSGIGIDATLINAEPELLPNITLKEGDVSAVTVSEKDFNVIFSLHLIEHLHPDDFKSHLQSVFDHLAPGGILFIITPHGLTGPHDISKYFDDYAMGFHLKEYSYGELASLFRRTGFVHVKAQFIPQSILQRMRFLYHVGLVPVALPAMLEALLAMLPFRRLQRKLAGWAHLNNIFVCAKKP